MTKRKTFDVQTLKDWVNEKLSLDCYSKEEKYGMINTLDHILNATGNYKGFGYVDNYNAENWSMEKDVQRIYY